MHILNVDIVYYIGKFLKKSELFYYSLTLIHENLCECFNEHEVDNYVKLCIKKHNAKRIKIIAKYHNIYENKKLIFYASGYNYEKFLKYLLHKNEILNTEYTVQAFKNALINDNLNILKIFMEYENVILNNETVKTIVKKKIFRYLLQTEQGCPQDIKIFKYFLKNTHFKEYIKSFANLEITYFYELLDYYESVYKRGELDLNDKKTINKLNYKLLQLQLYGNLFEVNTFHKIYSIISIYIK